MSANRFGSILLAALVCLGTGGCASLKRMTVNKLGDALSHRSRRCSTRYFRFTLWASQW